MTTSHHYRKLIVILGFSLSVLLSNTFAKTLTYQTARDPAEQAFLKKLIRTANAKKSQPQTSRNYTIRVRVSDAPKSLRIAAFNNWKSSHKELSKGSEHNITIVQHITGNSYLAKSHWYHMMAGNVNSGSELVFITALSDSHKDGAAFTARLIKCEGLYTFIDVNGAKRRIAKYSQITNETSAAPAASRTPSDFLTFFKHGGEFSIGRCLKERCPKCYGSPWAKTCSLCNNKLYCLNVNIILCGD